VLCGIGADLDTAGGIVQGVASKKVRADSTLGGAIPHSLPRLSNQPNRQPTNNRPQLLAIDDPICPELVTRSA